MKKMWIILIIFLFSCNSVEYKISTVGDTLEIESANVKLDEYDFDLREDDISIELTYIISPKESFILSYENVYLMVRQDKYYSKIEENIESNGIDIFQNNLFEECQYTFYFSIPSVICDSEFCYYPISIDAIFVSAQFAVSLNIYHIFDGTTV